MTLLTKTNKLLIGVLAVQVVLLFVIAIRSSGTSGPVKDQVLLAGFDAGAVTRVQLFADSKATGIDLVKRGKDWVMASHFDYPVDAAKVETALAPLAKMAAAEPTATAASRHKQLHVADGEFDRKLIVTAGGKDTIIFIGTSAGLRRNAVRLGGSEDVYGAAGISASTFGAQPRDWVKGSYYETPNKEITKISIQRDNRTVTIEKVVAADAGSGSGSGSGAPPSGEDRWNVSIDGAPVKLETGEKVDTFAINTVVSDIARIEASPADPKRDASKPTATVAVTRSGGTDTFDVILVEGINYWIKQRGVERATSIDKDRFKSVIDADRKSLVTKEDKAQPAPTGPGMPPPGMPPDLPFGP